MIVRAVAITSLLCVLLTVLYLPAAHPPQRFLQQVRIEHELHAAWSGHDHALRILAAMLDWHDAPRQASPLPRTFVGAGAAPPAATAVAAQLAHMRARVAGNAYFASLDALLALATYRCAGLLHGLPCVLILVGAALCDAAMMRIVKSKEFIQHDPERVALSASAALMAACATVILLVIPATVHPAWLVALPLATGVLTAAALSHFHRRG